MKLEKVWRNQLEITLACLHRLAGYKSGSRSVGWGVIFFVQHMWCIPHIKEKRDDALAEGRLLREMKLHDVHARTGRSPLNCDDLVASYNRPPGFPGRWRQEFSRLLRQTGNPVLLHIGIFQKQGGSRWRRTGRKKLFSIQEFR